MRSRKHEIITAMILDAEGRIQAHLYPADNPMGLLFAPAQYHIEQDLFKQAMAARETIVISSGGYSRTGFQEGVVPLFSDQKYLGVVRVRLSVAQLYEKAINSAFIVLALVLGFVIIGSALGCYCFPDAWLNP